jgi:hypothetical protein
LFLDIQILKPAISSIQFQKRKNAIFAEVQINGGLDMFTYIITDPIVGMMISQDAWYFAAF